MTRQLRPTALGDERSVEEDEAEGIVADLEKGCDSHTHKHIHKQNTHAHTHTHTHTHIGSEERLTRNEAVKVAWLPLSAGLAVCADGEVWELEAADAQKRKTLEEGAAVLCSSHVLSARQLTPLLCAASPLRQIILDWLEKGILYCEAEAEEEEEEEEGGVL